MNISNHCYQRYHERVREQNTPFSDALKERYSKELEAMYSHCKKIYSGIIGHSTRPVDVYIHQHGWVLISNDKEKTLITIYRIDLGINDPELNKQYIEKSLKRIDELQENLLESQLKIDEQKKSNNDKIAANEALIKEYTAVINQLKEQNENYRDLNKSLDADSYKTTIELRDAIENYMVKDAVKINFELD